MTDPQPNPPTLAQPASPPDDPRPSAAGTDRVTAGKDGADGNPTQAALRKAVEKLQQALPALQNADRSLAHCVEQIPAVTAWGVGRVVHLMARAMAAPRRVIELAIGPADLARLEALARSRTEPASRVERARLLLADRAAPSSSAVGAQIG